jgi:hypothetical protein
MQLKLLPNYVVPPPTGDLASRAEVFCERAPYKEPPFNMRNWGGPLHSLCSYQGKLKPSIAEFLVAWFTEPGDRVLDPMSGVGSVPLEARRQGRIGIGNDLSPLAATVTAAKLVPFDAGQVDDVIGRLTKRLDEGTSLNVLEQSVDVEFGLNGPIRSYFHPETLREILVAREFFLTEPSNGAAHDVVRSSVLHILHGNRPYALSRRSHPVTPFAPTGEFEYRPLIRQLKARLDRILPELLALSDQPNGEAHQQDFRSLTLASPVDAIVTSPPFAKSLRFWSMNWMRLWFAGWDPLAFQTEPKRYLETEQNTSFAPYAEFAASSARLLRERGMLVMHLGETSTLNMVEHIEPHLSPLFDVQYVGRECVADTESHGLRDKGATTAHWYLFARKR